MKKYQKPQTKVLQLAAMNPMCAFTISAPVSGGANLGKSGYNPQTW